MGARRAARSEGSRILPGFRGSQGSSGAAGPRLGRPQTRLGHDGHVGEVEVGPAAHAHGVVELDHAAAVRALPAQLVGLPAIEEGAEQSQERDHGADEEPDPEVRALPASDEARADPEAEHDRDEREAAAAHSCRMAQRIPTTATTATTIQTTPMITWRITLSSRKAAMARIRTAPARRRSDGRGLSSTLSFM